MSEINNGDEDITAIAVIDINTKYPYCAIVDYKLKKYYYLNRNYKPLNDNCGGYYKYPFPDRVGRTEYVYFHTKEMYCMQNYYDSIDNYKRFEENAKKDNFEEVNNFVLE